MAKNDIKSLERAVKKAYRQGYPLPNIIISMKKRGYPERIIRKVVTDLNIRRDIRPKKTVVQKVVSHWVIDVAIILIVIAVMALIIVLLPKQETAPCTDITCFAAAADNCDPASYTVTISGTVLSYQSQDCVLTKKVEQLRDDEPIEFKILFEGKNMTCPYEEGAFPVSYLEDLLAGIDTCSGELRDAIFDLRIAQLQQEI